MDEAIINYIGKKHNLLIGERTAEQIKKNIGTAYPGYFNGVMEIRGRSLKSGLPETMTVVSDEIAEAMSAPIRAILDAVHGVLESTPPELIADIAERGIVMTGGGSLLYGIDVLLSERMGINVVVAEDAIACVASGTGKFVEHIAKYNAKDLLAGKTGRALEFLD
jgi:rod shape-determining protein MreB